MTDFDEGGTPKESGVEQIARDVQPILAELKTWESASIPESDNERSARFHELFERWETLFSFQMSLQEYDKGVRSPRGSLDTYTQIAYGILSIERQLRGLGVQYIANFLLQKVRKLIKAFETKENIDIDKYKKGVVREAFYKLSESITLASAGLSPDDTKAVAVFVEEFGRLV